MSVRKDRYFCLQVHKAPPQLSKKEFETSVHAHISEWFALPVLSDNALSLNIILLNELLDKYASAAGMPKPRPTAMLCGEFQRPDHIAAVLRAPALREREGVYKSGSALYLFNGDIITKIDKPGPNNRAHGFATLKVPEGQSQKQYERTLGAISGRLVALPIAQNDVLSGAGAMRAYGFATSGAASFILHVEYENQDTLLKMASDAGIQILAEAVQDLNLAEASYFGANVITLLFFLLGASDASKPEMFAEFVEGAGGSISDLGSLIMTHLNFLVPTPRTVLSNWHADLLHASFTFIQKMYNISRRANIDATALCAAMQPHLSRGLHNLCAALSSSV
ncbi:hypothetical protein B0H13DRAFT_2314391 [Mycena leptocephala]|nr:hypothetical protein B0H13DRAFT_2314391 [Mycena leptocephala]